MVFWISVSCSFFLFSFLVLFEYVYMYMHVVTSVGLCLCLFFIWWWKWVFRSLFWVYENGFLVFFYSGFQFMWNDLVEMRVGFSEFILFYGLVVWKFKWLGFLGLRYMALCIGSCSLIWWFSCNGISNIWV